MIKYRADIDGLRALAVLPVVLFHAHIPGMSGGFVGVDIFFVISGYLICTLIANEIQAGQFSLLRFYERRCRRILPALFFLLIGVSGLASWILLPPDMESFCRSLLAAALFSSNIYFWRSASYFDGASEFKPLLHTWSLGVEEQFYIVMPVLLYAIGRWGRARFGAPLMVFSLVSFAIAVWGLSHAPTANFYLLPSRFWELCSGALVSLGIREQSIPRAWREWIGLAGAAMIGYAIVGLSEESPFPGWNALYPCVGAAAVILAGASEGSTVSRLLKLPPLVVVGTLSYSLYLWHWPLLALAKYHAARELTDGETAAVLAGAFIAAWFSWRFVETPVRRRTQLFTTKFIFSATAIAIVLASTVGLAGVSSKGFPARYPAFSWQEIPGKERFNERSCFLDEDQTYREWRGKDCYLAHGGGRGTVLLWGDSYAAHYAPGITDQAQQFDIDMLQYTASACPPIFGYYTATRPHCREFNEQIPRLIEKFHVTAVIMAGRWESLLKRGVGPADVAATVKRLQGLGMQVYVVGQSPAFYNDAQILFAQSKLTADAAEGSAPLSFKRSINSKLHDALPPQVFIDPLRYLCAEKDCAYRRQGQFMVGDAGHFSVFGSNLAVARYFPFYRRTANTR